MEETGSSDVLHDVKRTRIGIILLASGIGGLIMGITILFPPMDIFSHLITAAGYISITAGFILIFMGRGGFPEGHRKIARIGLYLLITATALILMTRMISIGLPIFDRMNWDMNDGVPGSDISSNFTSIRALYWVMILPTILGAAGFTLLLWNLSSGKGKIVLVLYVAFALMAPIGEAALMQVTNNELVKDIDDDRLYDEDEIRELGRDLKMKQYPVAMMGLAHLILLLMASLLSLNYVREREKEAYIGI